MDRKRMGNAAWGFRELALPDQLEITARMGLGIHELGIANGRKDLSLDATGEELEKVRSLYEAYGLGLVCAATSNDFTVPGSRQIRLEVEKVQGATELCAELGIHFLRIFAGFSPAGEIVGDRWDQMVEALRQVTEYADRKGVILCMETHGGVSTFSDGVRHFHSVTTRKDVLERLLESLPSSLKLVYDPANLYAAGVEHPEAFCDGIEERVGYIHLKDFVHRPSGNLVPASCGEGEMDWKPVVEQLRDFTGPVLFEYEIPQDVEQGNRRCMRFLEECVLKIDQYAQGEV